LGGGVITTYLCAAYSGEVTTSCTAARARPSVSLALTVVM
jgi:hypothetical protein